MYCLFFCPGNNKDAMLLQLLCVYESKIDAFVDIRHTYHIRGRIISEVSDYGNGKVIMMPRFDFSSKFNMVSPINRYNRLYLIKMRTVSIKKINDIINEIKESIV